MDLRNFDRSGQRRPKIRSVTRSLIDLIFNSLKNEKALWNPLETTIHRYTISHMALEAGKTIDRRLMHDINLELSNEL
jgi:hypothetical protein